LAYWGAGEFFGEGCLSTQVVRMATAVALTDCLIARLEKPAIISALRDEGEFSSLFGSALNPG
jgi:CRP/FNR family transcriptional regulator, cyclic AMP receptor protein